MLWHWLLGCRIIRPQARSLFRRAGSRTRHLSTRSRAAAGKPGGNSYSRLTIFWNVKYSVPALNGGRPARSW
ncbi:hypothetical protein HYQ46_000247 [Verticillium longisporum]|nr:hypothetical protein HYQ46_000247 [Verticillium longisporum]